MSNKPSSRVFKDDFPVNVSHVSFIKYSHFSGKKNDKKNEKSTKQEQKHIIMGGDAFYQLFLDDDDSNSINYKSFKNYYNKIFGLDWIMHNVHIHIWFKTINILLCFNHIMINAYATMYMTWKMINGCSKKTKKN